MVGDFLMIYAIVSLIISVGLVFGLRYIDKKQNSLDRMKHFVERAHKNFEEFFDQRNRDLKMLNDDLRAQRSEAIAAVKSLKDLEDYFTQAFQSIETKQTVIDNLSSQIADANVKFQQILDMSNLVDVNMQQIKEEAKFIDSVSVNVKKAKSELDSVQGEITDLHNTFQEENNRTLEKYKQGILETLSEQLEQMNDKFADAQQKVDGVLEVAKIKLEGIYKEALEHAVRQASELEGEAFETLKRESADRVQSYKRNLEESIQSTQDLASTFKTRWQEEASSMVAKLQSHVDDSRSNIQAQLNEIEKRTKEIEAEVLLKAKRLDEIIGEYENTMSEKLLDSAKSLNEKIEQFNAYSDTRLNTLKEQSEYKLKKFDSTVSEFDTIDTQLKTLLGNVKSQIENSFNSYKDEHTAMINSFSASFTEQAESLSEKVVEIESKIDELKTKSYENVSEKLKVFEGDFFSDLTNKKSELEDAVVLLHSEMEKKFSEISHLQEHSRKDLEEKYTKDLQARLVQLANSHKDKLSSFDKQIKDIEANLVNRIDAQNANIDTIANSIKDDVALAKENAKQELQKELSAYLTSLQTDISTNTQQFEMTFKKVSERISEFEQSYNDKMETANNNFQSWKLTLDKQFDSSRNLFNDKMSSFSQLAENAIKDFQEKHASDIEIFKTDNSEALSKLKTDLDDIDEKLETSKQDLVQHSEKVKLELNDRVSSLTKEFDVTMKQRLDDANTKVQIIFDNIVNVKSQIEKNKNEVFNVIQTESSRLTQSMQDLNEKQNEYLSHTKLFEKTDQLKQDLEDDIKNLQVELGKLSVYNSAIDDFKIKYELFIHQNDEVGNKIQKFMEEKTKVEVLEQEFTKLAALSESITKKQIELEAASDQMQKYQIQIRQLDDSIVKVNERYNLLDDKTIVLNQTIKDIDKAFANLNTIDASLKDSRSHIDSIVPDISALRREIDNVLKSQNEANDVIEKVKILDNMHDEIDAKMKSLQNSKEWLAGIESRLTNLDETVTQRIKLFATVYNTDDKTERAPHTTLSVSERQNIIELHRQGWKVEQIANAMKCTIGEVELILEMSDRYE